MKERRMNVSGDLGTLLILVRIDEAKDHFAHIFLKNLEKDREFSVYGMPKEDAVGIINTHEVFISYFLEKKDDRYALAEIYIKKTTGFSGESIAPLFFKAVRQYMDIYRRSPTRSMTLLRNKFTKEYDEEFPGDTEWELGDLGM